MEFKISRDIFEKCTEFANKSVDSSISKYASRNQFNKNKIIEDIRNGKIGEEIAWKFLSSKFDSVSKPDYNIYSKNQKSWAADLTTNLEQSIAVKTQNLESAKAYGTSWVFQGGVNNSYDTDKKIFKEKDDKHYACFVLIDLDNRIGTIKAIVKVNWLHENNLFKPMKLKHLQNNKSAIYFDDLQEYKDQLWQI